jgi:hypothetical protein
MTRLNLWFLPRAFFTARGPWVRPSPGIPCALSISEGTVRIKSGASARRECEPMSLSFLKRSINMDAQIASHSPLSSRTSELSGASRRASERDPGPITPGSCWATKDVTAILHNNSPLWFWAPAFVAATGFSWARTGHSIAARCVRRRRSRGEKRREKATPSRNRRAAAPPAARTRSGRA